MKNSSLFNVAAGLAIGFLTSSCGKEGLSQEAGKGPGKAEKERVALVPVAVELRPDGLAYLPGAVEPFTGEAVVPFDDMPWRPKLVEPYKKGKRDGEKRELFKDGGIKSVRRYKDGVPEYTASFHKNGQKKYEVYLNAQDRGEGPYSRWYETGVMEATAGLDAEERWHGEFKEWTREGMLKTHHVFKNGNIQQVIFESPESKAARLEKGVTLPGELSVTPGAPVVSEPKPVPAKE